MKYKVVVKSSAKADFENIYGYLKERFGKNSAARFKTSYSTILKSLRITPRMYMAVPEMPGAHKCTALSPTILLYEVLEQEKRVEILALYDGRVEHD